MTKVEPAWGHLEAIDGPKMAPRWLQDGLKIAQDGPVVKPHALDVLSVMARSRPDINKVTRWQA